MIISCCSNIRKFQVLKHHRHFHNYDIHESYLLLRSRACFGSRLSGWEKKKELFDKVWFFAAQEMNVNDPRRLQQPSLLLAIWARVAVLTVLLCRWEGNMKPLLPTDYLISFLLFTLGHPTDREMRQLLDACFWRLLRVQVTHDEFLLHFTLRLGSKDKISSFT